MTMGEQKTSGMMMLLGRLKPYLAMVSLQFGYAGMYIITMVSLKRGMSNFVLVVYRHTAATLVVAPFALILERKTRPKMTLSVFLKIIALGFLEPVLDQNFYYLGMKKTSATFASAMVNTLPAVTFVMAMIFRLEKVNLRKINGVAKVVGTVITVTGAMVMTLYKGPIVDIIWYSRSSPSGHHAATTSDQHWVMGTIMLLVSIGGWSAFFILQSITLKQYPAELSLTALVCFTGMVEGGALALAMERDMSAWHVGFDSRLLAAAYSGIVCSGIAYFVQGFVNRTRGPVFVTAFSPVSMIITAVLGAIVLAEKVHLGSLIGAIIIVLGLYSVVWGKSRDYLASESALSNGDEKGRAYELPVVIDGDKSTSIVDNHTHHDHGPATTKSKFPAKNPPSQEP